MVHFGVCCANLKDSKALMKMGLGLVLVGHVNFLLGALVHGAVLRHINVHARAWTTYAVSNVVAIVAGLVGLIGGIIAIVFSKNKKNRMLHWALLVINFLAGLLATASTIVLIVSMAMAIIGKGWNLLSECKFPDDFLQSPEGPSSITYECPFDPTRIYGTTLILWVPLIVMSAVEMVFCFHCFATFLYVCPCRRRVRRSKRVRIQRAVQIAEPARAKPKPEPEAVEQDELLEDGGAVAQQSSCL